MNPGMHEQPSSCEQSEAILVTEHDTFLSNEDRIAQLARFVIEDSSSVEAASALPVVGSRPIDTFLSTLKTLEGAIDHLQQKDESEIEPIKKLTNEQRSLVEEHADLVRSVALQAAAAFPKHVERSALVSAGNMGLARAAKRYDATKGVSFKHFAAIKIKGAILDYTRTQDFAPRSVRRMEREINTFTQEFWSRNSRKPTEAEIEKGLDLDEGAVSKHRSNLSKGTVVALEEHDVSDDSEKDLTLKDVLPDKNTLEPDLQVIVSEEHVALHAAIMQLKESHRFVIIESFFGTKSALELGEELGVTESRISQITLGALKKLERILTEHDS